MWWRPIVLVLSIIFVIIILQHLDDLDAPHRIFAKKILNTDAYEYRLICVSKMDAVEGGDFHISHSNITSRPSSYDDLVSG